MKRLLSTSISSWNIEKSAEEAKQLRESGVSYGLNVFRDRLGELVKEREQYISEEDVINIAEDVFGNILDAADMLDELALEYVEKTDKTRSQIARVSQFVSKLSNSNEGYVMIGKKSDNGFKISKKCLDPSNEIGKVIRKSYATIAMSGTLRPLEMYKDVLGFPENTQIREYKSDFPMENRMILIVKGVTTKYKYRNPEMFKKIGERISDVANNSEGNVGVFFPSYELLNQIQPFINTMRKQYIQKRRSTPKEIETLVNTFKRDPYGMLLAVAGGSLSEGIDFPGREMTTAIVVGIPLAEMDLEIKAQIDYYDKKFGKGWQYGYIYPSIIKTLQAAGRCIRKETDKGVIVLMDERYTWSNFSKALPKEHRYIITTDPKLFVRKFWSQNSRSSS